MRRGGVGTRSVGHDPSIDPRRVLVEFRDCPSGRLAMLEAEQIARRHHACLVVALVLGRRWFVDVGFGLAVTPAMVELEEDRIIVGFRRAVDALPDDLSIVSMVCRGSAGRALARVASQQRCDVVVIGRARAKRRQLWRGSAERYLRRHIDASVMVVSGAERPAAVPQPMSTSAPARRNLSLKSSILGR